MGDADRNSGCEELEQEVQQLRARLSEVEETLRAIRSGEVDALVITGEQGEQVYTLKGAELPYRTLIEEMREGAATLAADDTIIYCNQGFARMLKMPLEKVIGAKIESLVQRTSQCLRSCSGRSELKATAEGRSHSGQQMGHRCLRISLSTP